MQWVLMLLRPCAAIVFWAMGRFQRLHRRLPQWYFFKLGDVTPMTAFELWVVRPGEEGDEIFLVQRPADDPVWPNLWHFPGTIGRLHDDQSTVDGRLAEELGVATLPGEPKLFNTAFLTTPRGKHLQVFRRLDVPAGTEFPNGRFFPVCAIPNETIDYEAVQIRSAFTSRI